MTLDHNMDCWTPRHSTAVHKNLKALMQRFILTDVRRNKNPNVHAFTGHNGCATQQSQLDFLLVSKYVNIDKIAAIIIATPLPDNNAVSISIPLHSNDAKVSRSAYWKLNNSLLQHRTVNSDNYKQ